ncbi:unnamed protein product, partial [Linum tenue]
CVLTKCIFIVTSFIMVVVGGNRHQFRERRVRRQ